MTFGTQGREVVKVTVFLFLQGLDWTMHLGNIVAQLNIVRIDGITV